VHGSACCYVCQLDEVTTPSTCGLPTTHRHWPSLVTCIVGFASMQFFSRTTLGLKQERAPPPQVPATLAPRVHDCYHLPDVRGSDHCPIGIVLKGPPDDWAHALPVGAPSASVATAASASAVAVAGPPAGGVPVIAVATATAVAAADMVPAATAQPT